MKPDQQQVQTIEDILGSATNYRETYTELYDHILTALDDLPDNAVFIESLYHIVENELGGKKGIGNIEAAYKKAATKEIFSRYVAYFGSYVLSPFLLVSIALTVFVYWFISKSPHGLSWLLVIAMSMNAIPLIARKVIIAKARRDGTYGKSSVSKTVYTWFLAFPQYLFIALNVICFLVSLVIVPPFNSYLYTNMGAFFLNTFNTLALCRLLRDEFKLTVTI